MKDADLSVLFSNCFPNTLDTTVEHFNDGALPTSFIITGDIKAMWLRDSMNQLLPYISLLNKDDRLKRLILGAVRMQALLISQDPYANAYNYPTAISPAFFNDDKVVPAPPPSVFESKYELDSLASFLKLSRTYYNQTKDASYFNTTEWRGALEKVLTVVKLQQRGTLEALGHEDYLFSRNTDTNTETLYSKGLSAPIRRCGLVKSAFRPSDDATMMPFLVPANAMLVVELRNVAKMMKKIGVVDELYNECVRLYKEISAAIYAHAVVQHPVFGQVNIHCEFSIKVATDPCL